MAGKSGRRQFAKQVAVAGAAVVFGAVSAPARTSETGSEVDSRHQRILQQYGDRLSPEQKLRLRKILAYNQKMMEPIRNFPIENGQPTASVLKFYPDAGSRTK
ncbi:MAG TPA: hypothetical protein VH088_11395 [Terriglobales bacterium]|jgi:uncharacterized membrane protein|nr:hypothetical protein [Terriglobales bacterium]